MFFTLERATKILQDLQADIYVKRQSVDNLTYRDGSFANLAAVERSDQPWQEFPPGSRWGGRDHHGWFRAFVKIPPAFEGKTVAVWVNSYIGTGLVDDAANPQFMLYVNKQFVQGLDINHQEVIISRGARAGAEYQLDLHAYSGMFDKKTDIHVELVVIDEFIRQFCYDLMVAVGVARELPDHNQRRQESFQSYQYHRQPPGPS